MDYKLYQSNLILKYHTEFVTVCEVAIDTFKERFGDIDPTWNYFQYNVFNLTSSNLNFYNLFKELRFHIRSFIGDNRPLWLQAWLNYHTYDELESKLPMHNHDSKWHGYISIDPQDTTTIFKGNFEIKNKPGQIYLGPSGEHNTDYYHKVVNNSFYKSKRITIGFNITDEVEHVLNLAYLPLI